MAKTLAETLLDASADGDLDDRVLDDRVPDDSDLDDTVVAAVNSPPGAPAGKSAKGRREPRPEDVQSSAQAALAESPIFVLRELCVQRSGDALLLSGRVDSFYHKQLAQEAVRTVARGCRVVNAVDVCYGEFDG